jgi:hypothetical protein
MSRTIVSQQELLHRLNSEISKQLLCLGCTFTSITSLSELDTDGCNWATAGIHCGSGRAPAAVCAPKANQIIARARTLFNIM